VKNLPHPNRESSVQHTAGMYEEKSKTILEFQASKNHSINVKPAPAPKNSHGSMLENYANSH